MHSGVDRKWKLLRRMSSGHSRLFLEQRQLEMRGKAQRIARPVYTHRCRIHRTAA